MRPQDPTATPVMYLPRRIPFTLHSRLKDKLDDMEKSGIIAKVTKPTDWVNVLVVVEKPTTVKLRICLDPHDLNKSIKKPYCQPPTLNDVTQNWQEHSFSASCMQGLVTERLS